MPPRFEVADKFGNPIDDDNRFPVTFEGDVSFDTTNLEAGIGAPDDANAADPAALGSITARIGGVFTTLVAMAASLVTAVAHLLAIKNAVESTAPAGVVGFLNTVSVTPTVEATPDYSTGDVIGGIMTFAAILRADTKTAYAVSVRLTSKVAAASMAAIDVYIFNANPSGSTVTENAAFGLADADRAKLKGKISVSTWDVVGAAVSTAYAEGRVPITGAAADDIYVVMVARGTINLGSTSDLTVELTVDQN